MLRASYFLPKRFASRWFAWLFLIVTPIFTAPPAAAHPSPFQEQRLPGKAAEKTAALEGIVRDASGRPVPGARVTLRNLASGKIHESTSTAEGVFRLIELPAGRYELKAACEGYAELPAVEVTLRAGEVAVREITLIALPAAPPAPGTPYRLVNVVR